MAGVYNYRRDVLHVPVMIVMEAFNVGLKTLFKAATQQGMNSNVFVVYAYGVAALVLLPSPFFSYRSTVLPKMNFSIMIKIFFLGLIGCASQLIGYTGISFSSPILASAMSNLVPAFTFILALFFRMEKLQMKRISSRAKVLGTIVSIGGASVVTFYKGPRIISGFSPSTSTLMQNQSLSSKPSDWVLGGFFLTTEYLLIPVWYIVQAQIMKEYPAELTVTFFYNLYVCVMAGVVTSIIEPGINKWKFGSYTALASILCQGLFGSFLSNAIRAWIIRIRGPVYVSLFKPVAIVIAVIMGVMLLGDSLYLGSIIGAAIIVMGFYTVMWGKTTEEKSKGSGISGLESQTTEKAPLLQPVQK
ncbi:hypothetical protein Leryth_006889 [Lithospermum erythrorhizon]|nr:hypothetical protein Leryth_006889 [Lithospermum erythrorhizon]